MLADETRSLAEVSIRACALSASLPGPPGVSISPLLCFFNFVQKFTYFVQDERCARCLFSPKNGRGLYGAVPRQGEEPLNVLADGPIGLLYREVGERA